MRRESGGSTTDLEPTPCLSTAPYDMLRGDAISSDESTFDSAVYRPNQHLPPLGDSSHQDLQQDWTLQPDCIPLWNWDPLWGSVVQGLSADQIPQNLRTTGWDEDIDAYILQWAQYNQTFGNPFSIQL